MSKTVSLNGEQMTLTMPDGFHGMSDSELKSLGGKANPRQLVYRNEKKHMILNAMWKKQIFLVRKIALEKVAKVTHEQYKNMLPAFRNSALTEMTVAGFPARGFTFEYTAEGIDHVSEYVVFRKDNLLYAFSYAARKEDAEEGKAMFDSMLSSVTLA